MTYPLTAQDDAIAARERKRLEEDRKKALEVFVFVIGLRIIFVIVLGVYFGLAMMVRIPIAYTHTLHQTEAAVQVQTILRLASSMQVWYSPTPSATDQPTHDPLALHADQPTN